jgi:dihydrodipicolinate synthase/N-acetylneuraminate lyase
MNRPRPLQGVLPVIQTAFGPDEEVDLAATSRELDWLLSLGVSGLVTGMVSELLRLTERERQALAELVVAKAKEGGVASVIGCGAESTVTAVNHARHAERQGADAVMVIPPTTVLLDDAAIFDYYTAIGDAVDVLLVVQDAGGYVGRPMSIDVQVRLFERYRDRVYFKPEADPIGPRLSRLLAATAGEARVLEGSGGAALTDSFRRGVVGTMPGAEVCWAIQALWDALCEGDWSTAYEISGVLTMLVRLQTSIDAYVAVEKHLLVRQSVLDSPRARGPIGFTLDDETRAEVDRLFELLSARAPRRRAGA